MRTLITKKINGIEIVLGVDHAIIDPVTTKKAILKSREKEISEASHQADGLGTEYNKRFNELSQIASRRQPTQAEEQKVTDAYNKYIPARQKVFDTLSITAEEIREHAIYFEPRLGEELISDEKAKLILGLLSGLKKNQLLTADGTVIQNLVGQQYYKRVNGKLKRLSISKIGEELPDDSVLHLSPAEQAEYRQALKRQRIAGLSEAEKEKEKSDKMSSALARCAVKKNEYEILGDPDPLKKSKDHYKKLCEEIEAQYR
jgi:hypothetical protein